MAELTERHYYMAAAGGGPDTRHRYPVGTCQRDGCGKPPEAPVHLKPPGEPEQDDEPKVANG